MEAFDLIVVGGGPAGFFGALRFAALQPQARVVILEKTERVLQKVLISGGGRCNLSHDCDDPRELIRFYPRGGKALLNTFYQFGPRQTLAWFEERGLRFYSDASGCYFPVSNSSQSIIDVLTQAAQQAGIRVWTRAAAEVLSRDERNADYVLTISNGDSLRSPRLLFAAGGNRQAMKILRSYGIPIQAPVPSLFAFSLAGMPGEALAGITVEDVVLSLPGSKLEQRGALLITHRGFSGPAAINLSAWAARVLKEAEYQHPLRVDWLPGHGSQEHTAEMLAALKAKHPARMAFNTAPFNSIPARLWQHLCQRAEIAAGIRWGDLPKSRLAALKRELREGEYRINGRDAQRAEYVTCGGVDLKSLDLRRFESKAHPGLFFAGEILDVDGLTGGYNLQNCWSTAWVAANAMAICQD